MGLPFDPAASGASAGACAVDRAAGSGPGTGGVPPWQSSGSLDEAAPAEGSTAGAAEALPEPQQRLLDLTHHVRVTLASSPQANNILNAKQLLASGGLANEPVEYRKVGAVLARAKVAVQIVTGTGQQFFAVCVARTHATVWNS